MSISRIEIHGLRGFAERGGFDLAIPQERVGSGLTIIVGPNNAGKSTIIEAFTAISRRSSPTPPSFTRGKRNMRAGDRVMIQVTNTDGKVVELRTAVAGGSETIWDPLLPQPPILPLNTPKIPSIFVLPSRRAFAPYFGKSAARREEYLTNYSTSELRTMAVDNFSARLFNIQRDEETRAAFNSLLHKVLDYDLDWTIDREDTLQYFMKLRSSESYHSSEGLGEGLISLIFIIDALYDSNAGDVIVIDEPELSLHPSLQKKLYTLLIEFSATRQIVIATHSPYFVGPESILNGGKIVRVIKRDERTVLFSPSDQSIKSIKGIIADTHNPHGFGLDAREIFFLEERVILVEGQEDVVFYRMIADQLNCSIAGHFYGWGVGRAEKMVMIAQLLQELGFEHVVGILDKNKEEKKPQLEALFPSYQFFLIPADDVRSKPERKSTPAVHGLVAHDGVLNNEYRDSAVHLLKSINAALSTDDDQGH